ncbi:MAG: funZ protein [Cyanobacteriota bacterium]|nr:funZ protein [Cyanobacteriota bacterium]
MTIEDKTMLRIQDLNLGFNDAENYKRSENKSLLNKVFFRTDELDRLCERSTFFLIGEKGTGKTACAVYLSNNDYKDTLSSINYIRETDYQKFVQMKKREHLALSDYVDIWKVILYLLISKNVSENEPNSLLLPKAIKFRNINSAVDEYYARAFSPEIINAIKFVEKSKIAAELVSKYAKASGEESEEIAFSESLFQINLMYVQKKFEEAFSSLKLQKNHLLFIDGIDIRPSRIDYEDYLECVKGLANAVWAINNDVFPKIKDSKGRLKVVLLVRPDIFDSIGLQNRNNKIRDNSVLLNWNTTYKNYRNSKLFEMAGKLVGTQQNPQVQYDKAWDYYFPYTIENKANNKQSENDPSFIGFLRYSLYRPRDIVTMLSILKENFIEQRQDPNRVFSEADFFNAEFVRKYSEYLLGEIKDQLSFYYTENDYQLFLKFFEYLKGKSQFSYDDYLSAYQAFVGYLDSNSIRRPKFSEAPDVFLQFLYELNVIFYIEKVSGGNFIRLCLRERNPTNISPKVKTHQTYQIHYGLIEELNVGKKYTTLEVAFRQAFNRPQKIENQ